MGPDTYDLASLLRDSYVDLTDRELDELIAYFLALKGEQPDRASAEFRRRFDLMALQRNLKALGTFGYQTIDAPESRLYPVHPAHAALRRGRISRSTRASPGCASSSPRTSRSCGQTRSSCSG